MRRIPTVMLATWFAAALLLSPALHTHGGPTRCADACGSHDTGPAPAPADGQPHDDCPACQFAFTTAVAPVGSIAAAATMIPTTPTVCPAWKPAAPPCVSLPPSCGPPQA